MATTYVAVNTTGMSNSGSLVHILLIYYVLYVQRWARAYTETEYHAAVNTNNGAEALNKVLKYRFLPRRKAITLSSLVTLLVESYFPEARRNYLCLNYMQTNQYRKYKSIVPEYLQDRPRTTILHCLERKSKSHKYTIDDISAIDIELGVFEVKKSENKSYTVSFGFDANDKMPFCTCPDWIKWHLPCKHFFAVFSLYPSWNWYKLPQAYLESAYMSTDQQSLDNFFKRTVEHNDDINFDTHNKDDDGPGSDNASPGSDNGSPGSDDASPGSDDASPGSDDASPRSVIFPNSIDLDGESSNAISAIPKRKVYTYIWFIIISRLYM